MADIDKALPNVETEIKTPSEEEIAVSEQETIKEQKKNHVFFDFENMPAGEIIRSICLVQNLKCKIDNAAVVITHSSIQQGAANAQEKIVELEQEIKDLQAQVEELEKLVGNAKNQCLK